MNKRLAQRITFNPEVCFGEASIRNLPYRVDMILDLLSAGMRIEEIVKEYPALEREDIQACLEFAADQH